jgi:hypothetical protein
MTQSTEAKYKLEDFVGKLASLGYEISEVRKKPQTYNINGKLVNIRSRGKIKQTADGSRLFWYSVAFSVLKEVDWVIYLMTEANYFVMLPSSFLLSMKDYMYPDKNKAGVGVFDIDWDSLVIELRGKRPSIKDYYRNLSHKEDYPKF